MTTPSKTYAPLDVSQLANVPEELQAGVRYVCWREAIRNSKPTKIPVNPHTGADAESDNPVTWGTLAEAVTFYQAHRDTLQGVGRMFDASDGIIGIDFDDCLDGGGNIIASHAAAEWLPRLNSYSEVSPSGTGVKILLRAKHDLGGKTGRRDSKQGVEIYKERRYFTLTGKVMPQFSGKVEKRQSPLDEFFNEIFGKKKDSKTNPATPTITTLPDAEIITRASNAKNGARFSDLWAGNWQAHYGSQSEADAALVGSLWFWTGNRDAVARLFAQSGLMRDKWNRNDYRKNTLDFSCTGEVYSQGTKPAPAVATVADWPEPSPLPEDLPPVPAFDFTCLPDPLRPWLEDIAERMQCPPDFPAVAATVALGSIIGRKIGIRPKRFDDWLVIPNLWGAIVGRPGLMKTPAAEQALLPLRRLVAEALKMYEAQIGEHKVNLLLKTQRAKIAERKIAEHLKDGDEAGARSEAQASARADDTEPTLRRYEVNDSTVAKLGELLAENPTGLLIHRDELIGFLRGLDKEGSEEARAFYLESWNGTGSFTFDRIGRGTVRVESNTLAVMGGIQPDLLTSYVRDAVRGGMGADGLLQRFQLFVWPDISKDWRNVDRWPDTKAKNEAFAVFKYLDELTPDQIGADTSGEIPSLRFMPEAQGRFDHWRAQLEAKLRDDSEHPAFEAHLSKYRKLVPALALLMHLAGRDTGPVTLAALDKALTWARYLEGHARRIYSAVLRPDTASARELAKRLQRGELAERFTLREVYRRGWAGLSSKEDAEAATEILADAGWIRPVAEDSGRTGGRPASPTFQINPKTRNIAKNELTKLPQVDSVSSVSDQRKATQYFQSEREKVKITPSPSLTELTKPPRRDYDSEPPADYLPEAPSDQIGKTNPETEAATSDILRV